MTRQLNCIDRRPFNWLWAIILLLILIILFLILWHLFLREPPEEPAYFAMSEVVITGPEERVEEVAQAAATQLGIELLPVDFRPEVPFLDRPSDTEQQEPLGKEQSPQTGVAKVAAIPQAQPAVPEPTIFSYRIVDARPEPVTVPVVINEIRLQADNLNYDDVRSDPNYVIGRPVVEIEGDPHCGEAAALSPAAGSAEDEFNTQWALDEQGVELLVTDANGVKRRNPDLPMGDNVMVALFDTSPFDFGDLPANFANTSIWHFEVAGIPDARDHGVFGASLVNAVAPASELRIYRVLNETNHGDLGTLLRALELLLAEWQTNPNRPKLVINLSLSVHLPPEEERNEANAAIFDNVETLENMLREAARPGDFDGDIGVVIVAASGNDSSESFRQGEAPATAQIPASYEFVIGVGASNINGRQSCFSNSAHVYAPGGDNNADCMPAVQLCANDPSACMIGYSVHASPVTHYAFWNGTSFAAPLVSGQAALLLEADMPPAQVKQHIIDTAKPMLSSDGTQSTSGGIANIPASMP